MIVLSLLTALLVIAFFLVLAVALIKISDVLRAIGGTPTSYLAKLRLGLRAIESETGHLAPQVTRANEALANVAAGLGVIDGHLVATIKAAVGQESYRQESSGGTET